MNDIAVHWCSYVFIQEGETAWIISSKHTKKYFSFHKFFKVWTNLQKKKNPFFFFLGREGRRKEQPQRKFPQNMLTNRFLSPN